jgi:hypothetical protein
MRMQVKVALEELDYKRGLQRISTQAHGKHYWLSIVAAIISFPSADSLFDLLQKQDFYKRLDSSLQAVGGMLLFLGIYFLIYQFLARYSPLPQYSRPDGMTRSPGEYRIDREGFHHNCRYKTSFIQWPGVVKIVEDKEFILFYIDAMAAYIIPKRFFNSSEEATAFAAQAREFWEAAKKADPNANTAGAA